jgi:hypothetical protein
MSPSETDRVRPGKLSSRKSSRKSESNRMRAPTTATIRPAVGANQPDAAGARA